MRKTLLAASALLYFSGISLVALGALYKIQSWEAPGFLGGLDLLTLGLLINFLATAALLGYLYGKFAKQSDGKTVETTLVLEDLPDTVREAEDILRRDEGMIV